MAYVIGTAGHVDHGKSALVKALTGIDPDRLAEEKEREMTIDLGFAWLTLPGGESVGIVDVPGHRDFIENMLAGVGSIDLALLVVAADEGVMPQTVEHLAILDLLEVGGGVVALSKVDLVRDQGWLELVEAEVGETLSGTVLDGAPIVRVSARTGFGLDDLLSVLESALADCPPRPERGRPRLPIDRVFTISGFGTVVTGTLIDGSFAVGDEVEIQPAGSRARIRGLQSHKEKIDVARPGSRVAINLSGVDKHALRRGDVVTGPGLLLPTTLIDTQFRYLADAGRPLRHNTEVKLFVGAAEVVAHVRLLGDEELAPGAAGWLQLRLSQPVAVERGDRFILRLPPPGQTIGGGMVLDPHPAHRWRRFRSEVLERLETLAIGSPDELLLHTLESSGPLSPGEAARLSGLGVDEVEALIEGLMAGNQALRLADGRLLGRARWERTLDEMRRTLEGYHKTHPLRLGMPREALRSRLGMDGKAFSELAVLAAQSGALLTEEGGLIRLPEHAIRFRPDQQATIDGLRAAIRAAPMSPPSVKEATAQVGADVLQALVELGELVQVSPDVLFDAQTYDQMARTVQAHIAETGSITVAQARDLFGTSRKYVLALLEHLDEIGLTRRVGDERVLR
jgi:selenocysteine-specific elongation factor